MSHTLPLLELSISRQPRQLKSFYLAKMKNWNIIKNYEAYSSA